ncbi:hypothetical protein [Longimicrobium sp.]|uniref:hypothetical protein n=1 Tax=Longimicrobium sp. TaxID=2029185 RepID=UPI003B3AE307
MPAIFRYFWLLMLVVVAVNAFVYRRRFRTLEAQGVMAPADSARLLRAWIVGLGGLCVALAALQLAAGWESPFCVHDRPLADPFVLGSLLVTAVAWAAFLAWIFVWGGDALVSRASPALTQRYPGHGWSPRTTRIGAVLIVLASVASGVIARQTSPAAACDAGVARYAEVG